MKFSDLFSRDLKIGIVGGLVSTGLFIYLLEPLTKISVHAFSTMFGGFSRWFVDSACKSAALGVAQDSGLFVLSFVQSMSAGVFCGGVISFLVMRKARRALKRAKNAKSPDDRLAATNEAEAEVSRLESFPLFRHTRLLAIPLGLLAMIGISVLVSHLTLTNQLVSSFNQHINALSASVDDTQLKQWRSKWAQMESRQSYDAIYTEMRAVADRSKVKLLKNPTYSSFAL